MPGPDQKRLALITWTLNAAGKDDGARAPGRIGTGYFVTANLVLTAAHVAPQDDITPVRVRVENGQPRWRDGKMMWRDESLDAALIRVGDPLPTSVAPVEWTEDLPAENSTWNSTGYPDASDIFDAGKERERKSAGLEGPLYVQGGGGQGAKELELGVNNPPPQADWAGVSGAPVFVESKLIGIVKSAGYDGRRLHGVPASALLQNVAFRRAIEPAWLELPQSASWLLVLLSETGAEDLVSTIQGSLLRHEEAIVNGLGCPLSELSVVSVRITDALKSPERWLRLIEFLCLAPIMIADVTNFEPGVMLTLGVRAVVRRGVTIASTANRLDDKELSTLPFNIQEAKLISHGDNPDMIDQDPRYSLNMIATTILSGLQELRTNTQYLDLPAYDAVRCPAPELPAEHQRAREAVLVLCSFHREYQPNWHKLLDGLAKRYPAKRIVRMRDIASPRLVGQALYEHIRWTKTCIVDWTHWRANVFFEFGVRLACSDLEPVCLLDQDDAIPPTLAQTEDLIRLFGPTLYSASNLRAAVHEAVADHELQKTLNEGQTAPPRPLSRLPINGTHRAGLAAFEYSQERVTMLPHVFLRSSVETLLGKDRQRTGDMPVLFASNPAFARELRYGVRERWIAAWFYLRNRYSEEQLKRDAKLCGELKQLGERLLQEVRDDPGDPSIARLRETVIDLIDSLDEYSARNPGK